MCGSSNGSRATQFRLHHERIGELGVPLARIHEALAPRFELLEATNTEGRPANDESDRAYFVYRHRAPTAPSPWPPARR